MTRWIMWNMYGSGPDNGYNYIATDIDTGDAAFVKSLEFGAGIDVDRASPRAYTMRADGAVQVFDPRNGANIDSYNVGDFYVPITGAAEPPPLETLGFGMSGIELHTIDASDGSLIEATATSLSFYTGNNIQGLSPDGRDFWTFNNGDVSGPTLNSRCSGLWHVDRDGPSTTFVGDVSGLFPTSGAAGSDWQNPLVRSNGEIVVWLVAFTAGFASATIYLVRLDPSGPSLVSSLIALVTISAFPAFSSATLVLDDANDQAWFGSDNGAGSFDVWLWDFGANTLTGPVAAFDSSKYASGTFPGFFSPVAAGWTVPVALTQKSHINRIVA